MKYLINLFPSPEKSRTDKFIYFAFHYLRYILVITQFVAICVFFFRFKVDQDIVDLQEKADQKQSIIVATKDLLSRMQEVDAKKRIQNSTISPLLVQTPYLTFLPPPSYPPIHSNKQTPP